MGRNARLKTGVLLLIAFAWAGAAWGAIPVAERDALVDLYGDTGGPTWVNSTNWLGASGTEGTWFGITVELVDGGDHVTGIELAENNLTGNLPADFNAFTRLRILDLHWNYGLTSGPIPDCSFCASLQTLDLDDCVRTETSFPSWIPNLSSLQVLSLNFNDLSGPLPPNLWTVTTLTKLDLGVQNQYDDTHGFSGTISQDVTDLVNLTYLDLSYNHFTGTLPDLSSMTQLRTLFLGVNPVDSQEFPAWIASMSGLTQLGLEQLGLTGSIPASIGNLTQLTLLSLESNPFDPGPAPGELALLTHLEQLDLRACNLTSLPDLSPLTALNRLYLGSNPLAAGPVPTWVVSLTLLEIFQMVGCNLIGTIPEGLCTLPNLYYIHLADNDLTGPIPSQIGNLASLRYLYLNGNNLTGGIPPSLGNCPLLRFLFLHDNQLTGNLPSALGNCTALRYLYANDNLLSGAIPPEI